MNSISRLLIYSAGLVLVFGVMYLAGRAVVPETTVASWTREAEESGGEHEGMGEAQQAHVRGTSVEQDGYRLEGIHAPDRAGVPGEITFRVIGPDGEPFRDFAISHERELHLIVVRTDGSDFRHLHPDLDEKTGIWTAPIEWPKGGAYRVFTDFVPAGDSAPDVTLGGDVQVAGAYSPRSRPPGRTDSVDGFEVSVTGDLVAEKSAELTIEVTRDGKPETSLQPYLGAFGHLVALREGDLAFLHVHAEEEPGESEAGPEIAFETEAPTPGRYLLYLDFKVDGRVHTAEFVLEAK